MEMKKRQAEYQVQLEL
jgi:ATPase family AAA domain-containing protein 3A/B